MPPEQLVIKMENWKLFRNENRPFIDHNCNGIPQNIGLAVEYDSSQGRILQTYMFPEDFVCGDCGDKVPEQLALLYKIIRSLGETE